MKKESKPLSWLVTEYDCNANKIQYYNILKYREDDIKKMKKQCNTREEFAETLRSEMMYRYWSKCEWELIIKLTEDGRVILSPWAGCRNPDEVEIDVTDREDFDWKSFAELHISKQRYGNEAKIDVYAQLTYGDQFEKLVTYLWTTRLKYERDNPKFHR